MDIWSVERTESGWSTLRNLGPPVNTELHETGGSVAADGTLYFDADYTRSSAPSGYGGRDIYCSRLVDGQYTQPQLVPAPVSSEHMESIPAVAPDHSYLVFASGGRADSLGERDLYVTFRLANGCWTAPVSLGPEVNSEYTEKFPSISPDGKYLFFVSYRPPAADLTIEDAEYELLLRRRLGEPREGSWGDIYWISTQVITSLRQ